MPIGGQLREVHVVMHKLRQMPTDEQLRELRVAMRILLWKMLRVLTLGRFCIPISSKKRVTRIIKFTRLAKTTAERALLINSKR
ncbi:unnamed protein product [Sphagnum balticum]